MTVCVSQVNSTTPPKRGRWIQALQGLRAVSFLGVFLCHSGVGGFACVGRFAVSVFFVLSGFLMAYRYLQKQNDPRFGFSFVWSKIRKLYSLHITAMVVSIPYYLSKVLAGACTLATLVACMVLNVGMLQVWVPWQSMYEMLNAPSWFMAPLVLSYLLFPLLLKALRKIRSARSVLLLAIPFLVFYLAVVFVAARVQFLSSGTDLVDWLAYYFPPLRFCDFALGCVLGWLFLHRGTGRGDSSFLLQTAMHVVLLALTLACLLIYKWEIGLLGSHPVREALLFLPVSCLAVWVVAMSSGVYERIWSLPLLGWIADLSPYAFLIHWDALIYIRNFFRAVLPFSSKVNIVIGVLVAFAVTMALSACWKRFVADRGRR